MVLLLELEDDPEGENADPITLPLRQIGEAHDRFSSRFRQLRECHFDPVSVIDRDRRTVLDFTVEDDRFEKERMKVKADPQPVAG